MMQLKINSSFENQAEPKKFADKFLKAMIEAKC